MKHGERMIDTLRAELGDPFLFQWVAACAVYPGLRWPLTAYLGEQVANVMGRKAPITETEHWAIARLLWFRTGQMPDDLRLQLIAELDRPVRRRVRRVLHNLFDRIEFAAEEHIPETPRALFLARAAAGDAGEAARDDIFVRYMMGSTPNALDLALDRGLARLLRVRLAGWLDRRTIAAAVLAGAATLFAWNQGEGWLRPWFQVEVPLKQHDIQMVALPPGSFQMGDLDGGGFSDEKPVHGVDIGYGFAVGKFAVTFEQWDACVSAGGCMHRPDDRGWGRGNRPVIDVSWDDAKEYVLWLSTETGHDYRLLTEAEWEYAARAGGRTAYPWGNDWDDAKANGIQVGPRRTMEVGRYPANVWGLHDMNGNVWEWVDDCWHDSYNGAPTDGRSWTSGSDCCVRVLRGGSWGDEPGYLRSANRYGDSSVLRDNDVGFRIARTLS